MTKHELATFGGEVVDSVEINIDNLLISLYKGDYEAASSYIDSITNDLMLLDKEVRESGED